MAEQDPPVFRPWIWFAPALVVSLIVFNLDSIGGKLAENLGSGAKLWGTNIIILTITIFYAIVLFRRRR